MPDSEKQQATAPYASWKSFKTFLELLADMGVPERIDRTVMSRMSGATQSNIRVALLFLKLTDSDGSPTTALRELVDSHGANEEWKSALRGVILPAYEPVIADLSLDAGTADQLWKCFREHGGVRGSTLSRAVRFFLAALREAGVSHSPYFKPPRRPSPPKVKEESERVPGIAKTPETRRPPQEKKGSESREPAVAKNLGDNRGAGWRSHSFHLPNYREPVEVKAPEKITKEEWELINLFMVGTIRLAERAPSPSDCSEDEGQVAGRGA
ncbi:MAG: hypothetical protein F4X60_13615 [Gemmatimonadetes bacterium]|nr:hypothetical protein [Gemmatimonadota bacterium]MYB99574.1 hypothetical protein [Gemmatimonadota bacterium]MYI36849.1 hypothetical protein [Acidimicrobiaceae bacterium]